MQWLLARWPGRKASMTASYPIRTITPAEFEAFAKSPARPSWKSWHAEALRDRAPGHRVRPHHRGVRRHPMVGTAGAYTFRLTVPGGVADAAGVSLVSVLPSHRRRGILTDMMRHVVAGRSPAGEAIAILYASESGIYGRFGFGLATWQQRIRIGRGDGQLSVGPAVAESKAAAPALRRTCRGPDGPGPSSSMPCCRAGRACWPRTDGLVGRPALRRCRVSRDGMSQLRCVLAEDEAGPRGLRAVPDPVVMGRRHSPTA